MGTPTDCKKANGICICLCRIKAESCHCCRRKNIYMAAGRNYKWYSTLPWHKIAMNIVPFFPSLSVSIYFAMSSYTLIQIQRQVFLIFICAHTTSYLQYLGIAQGGTLLFSFILTKENSSSDMALAIRIKISKSMHSSITFSQTEKQSVS